MSVGFLQQCVLFTVVLIASNIFETKQIDQFVLKTAYEIVFLPVVIYYINRIKKFEESDITDTDVSYNIFKF